MIPDQMNDNHLSSNYRPILNNLQPMYKRACSFICKFELITKQFGFKANYSTEHALISPIETTKCDLDSGPCLWLYVCDKTLYFVDLQKKSNPTDDEYV